MRVLPWTFSGARPPSPVLANAATRDDAVGAPDASRATGGREGA